MTDDLPPLPPLTPYCEDEGYSADQMRAYARAAVEAERERIIDGLDVLLEYGQSDGRRDWLSGGGWAYPGEVLAIVDLAAIRGTK